MHIVGNNNVNNFVLSVLCKFEDESIMSFGFISGSNEFNYDDFELDDLCNNESFKIFLHYVNQKSLNDDLGFTLSYSFDDDDEIDYPSNFIPILILNTIGVGI